MTSCKPVSFSRTLHHGVRKYLTILDARASAYPTTPTPRSARAWDSSHVRGVRCVVVESQYVHRHCVPKAASHQGQQNEGQQKAARGSRLKESSQPPGAAASRHGQQPAAWDSRLKGSSQPLRVADRGAIPQTAVTHIFLEVILSPKRAFLLHDSKNTEVKISLNIYRWAKR